MANAAVERKAKPYAAVLSELEAVRHGPIEGQTVHPGSTVLVRVQATSSAQNVSMCIKSTITASLDCQPFTLDALLAGSCGDSDTALMLPA